jgi:hypothetical protein
MKLSEVYKLIYDTEFEKLPKWKQNAINEDLLHNKSTGMTTDFIKLVIEKAEKHFEENKGKPKKELISSVD